MPPGDLQSTTQISETAHMNGGLSDHNAKTNKIDQAICASEESYNEKHILADLDMVFDRLNRKYYEEK